MIRDACSSDTYPAFFHQTLVYHQSPGVFEMKSWFSRFLRYVIVFIMLVAFGVGMLFLCGLAPQEQVEKNYLLSLDEIEPEWDDFNIIRRSWGS